MTFRTMRVNWRLFRNKWTPGAWSHLRKRRSPKKKVSLPLFTLSDIYRVRFY